MSKFLTFKSLHTEEPITINLSHIVSIEPADEGECFVRLSTDKIITVEADYEALSVTLEHL
ncbi:hypothetical protein L1D15_10060 [Vibrio sp. Isolate25]|uniref:hypothetical protein n=1 Tax=Vibrio sp. Isolate25 TaxID=2908535 RepID=UPI001EFEA15D|nr:hypothetical protein [Vibrio sp. Isolate25]MCG9597070.1 hypothetical protein [Vibrio sp. Isolate25]